MREFPDDRSTNGFSLLRDIRALFVLSAENHMSNSAVMDASKELRDDDLLYACMWLDEIIKRQQAECQTMTRESAAQSIVAPA